MEPPRPQQCSTTVCHGQGGRKGPVEAWCLTNWSAGDQGGGGSDRRRAVGTGDDDDDDTRTHPVP